MEISEILVVEGRDDTQAVKRAVTCETIETHGFGMSEAMWAKIEKACAGPGIIVFTDPDSAGERIRRKILDRFPEAKQAFLPRAEALKKGDIGVENASPEAIREALQKAHATKAAPEKLFAYGDVVRAGLAGGPGSRERRRLVCESLGVGYCNAKGLAPRLNGFGVTREEFYGAVRSADDPIH